MGPLTDDDYWFARAKQSLDTNLSNQDAAAGKLQTMILWFWGVYTAAISIGVGLSKSHYSVLTLSILALPSLLLVMSYAVAGFVQMPLNVKFDSRVALLIREAYNMSAKSKEVRLKWAVAATMFSSLAVGVALITASTQTELNVSGFTVKFNASPPKYQALISGYFPGDSTIKLFICSVDSANKPITLASDTFMVLHDGRMTHSMNFQTTASSCSTRVQWSEDGGERTISKNTKLK